ncbi:class I SAM-dependent methyltransferase [Candidatus Woesearchaeota archaeon]|nr:class I SAM-dependent methyltransferase [Candidatus Woesearchaeota archaeon]
MVVVKMWIDIRKEIGEGRTDLKTLERTLEEILGPLFVSSSNWKEYDDFFPYIREYLLYLSRDPKLPIDLVPQIVLGKKIDNQILNKYKKIVLDLCCGRPDRKGVLFDAWIRNKDTPEQLKELYEKVLKEEILYVGIDALAYFPSHGYYLEGPSPMKLEKIPQKYRRKNVIVIKGDIDEILPFIKDESIDFIVYSWGDWEHRTHGMEIIPKILKPGGKYFICPYEASHSPSTLRKIEEPKDVWGWTIYEK